MLLARYSLLYATLLISASNAQNIGTITQDITTYAAYSQQKKCARSCIVDGGPLCFTDVLGAKIGCAQSGTCQTTNWAARNDCYCRGDMQAAGFEFLSNCVSSKCSVADVSVDVSSAVNLYSRYCGEKGYAAGVPASVRATATGTTSGAGGVRTASTPDSTSNAPGGNSSPGSSGSSSLSIGTIIGIVVGSSAGLFFLAMAMYMFWKLFASCRKGRPSNSYQVGAVNPQPVYPPNSYQQPWYPPPGPSSEVGPSDSVSMVGGLAQPTPTLLSDNRHAGRW